MEGWSLNSRRWCKFYLIGLGSQRVLVELMVIYLDWINVMLHFNVICTFPPIAQDQLFEAVDEVAIVEVRPVEEGEVETVDAVHQHSRSLLMNHQFFLVNDAHVFHYIVDVPSVKGNRQCSQHQAVQRREVGVIVNASPDDHSVNKNVEQAEWQVKLEVALYVDAVVFL